MRKAKKKKSKALPNKPSELIRLAVHDLSEVERLKKKYRVDMNVWHKPNSHCSVCFAGSVMAITKGFDPKKEASLDKWSSEYVIPEKDDEKYSALNCFRSGEIGEGLSLMGLGPAPVGRIEVEPYSKSGSKVFKKQMLGIAALLEAYGF